MSAHVVGVRGIERLVEHAYFVLCLHSNCIIVGLVHGPSNLILIFSIVAFHRVFTIYKVGFFLLDMMTLRLLVVLGPHRDVLFHIPDLFPSVWRLLR